MLIILRSSRSDSVFGRPDRGLDVKTPVSLKLLITRWTDEYVLPIVWPIFLSETLISLSLLAIFFIILTNFIQKYANDVLKQSIVITLN